MAKMQCVTCTAPVNIAVIKYWGKRDEQLILPLNDSLSLTLNQDEMQAKTTVMISPDFTQDRIWLNEIEIDINSTRLQNCIKQVRKISQMEKSIPSEMFNWNIHICSKNNFPTAAGLASSAAGYACLVFALAKLYSIHSDISVIARQGSGSACRSIYGGFVQWVKGSLPDGTDSNAIQVAAETHWPEIRIVILVVSAKQKETGSTTGMSQSVATSNLLQLRLKQVPQRMEDITRAIMRKDFHAFSKITMEDSDEFHDVCADTDPPIYYLNDTSRAIIDLVHQCNNHYGTNKVAYTFDAGPNACLFTLEKDLSSLLDMIEHFFPSESQNFFKGITFNRVDTNVDLIDAIKMQPRPNSLEYAIVTKVGDGPRLLDDSQHLLNKDGFPLEKH